jgi:hypothetical protein
LVVSINKLEEMLTGNRRRRRRRRRRGRKRAVAWTFPGTCKMSYGLVLT